MPENKKLQLPERPRLMLKSHYIANLQVNNPIADLEPTFKMGQHKTNLTVNFQAKPLGDNVYVVEHVLGLTLSDNEGVQLFDLKLNYRGIFDIDMHKDSPGLNQYILIQGASHLFPFMRALVRTLTADSNHVPLNVANINYERIYAQELQKIAKEKHDSDNLEPKKAAKTKKTTARTKKP